MRCPICRDLGLESDHRGFGLLRVTVGHVDLRFRVQQQMAARDCSEDALCPARFGTLAHPAAAQLQDDRAGGSPRRRPSRELLQRVRASFRMVLVCLSGSRLSPSSSKLLVPPPRLRGERKFPWFAPTNGRPASIPSSRERLQKHQHACRSYRRCSVWGLNACRDSSSRLQRTPLPSRLGCWHAVES